MDAIEKRARAVKTLARALADEYQDDSLARELVVSLKAGQLELLNTRIAIRALIAALTPPEGHVVVTRNEAGQAVAVTWQDDEGRILSVIAEFSPPEGYVLVPVDQDSVDFYVCDACGHHYMEDGVTCDCTPNAVQPPLRHVRMIAESPGGAECQ